MQSSDINKSTYGWWTQGDTEAEHGDHAVRSALLRVTQPVNLLNLDGQLAIGRGGTVTIGKKIPSPPEGFPLLAYAPPLPPENLGDPKFKKTYDLRPMIFVMHILPAPWPTGLHPLKWWKMPGVPEWSVFSALPVFLSIK